jgi:starch phosphorylase
MEISIDKLLEPGVQYQPENFVMTKFALNVSRKANGVSKLHTRFSQEHWPEYNWCNVTNGVHMPTWQKENIRTADPKNHQALWDAHLDNKRKLMEFVQEKTGIGYDPNHLIVSWARRIAKYKRPQDIFQDIGRLAAILKNQERPVHILMAGKAHASDTQAKMFLQEILHYMQNEIKGHAIFVPDYNIDVAKYLVSGSDVWLNTPEYGKEASGTSGMKAVSNGVLQCTVRDGWADEVEWHGMGWVLDHQNIQSSFYTLLEYEIAQMYYNRNEQGLPEEWLTRMERSIELSKNFSASRMLDEYIKVLYKE